MVFILRCNVNSLVKEIFIKIFGFKTTKNDLSFTNIYLYFTQYLGDCTTNQIINVYCTISTIYGGRNYLFFVIPNACYPKNSLFTLFLIICTYINTMTTTDKYLFLRKQI